MTVTIDIKTTTLIRRIAWIFGFLVFCYLLFQIRQTLIIFIVAGFIALAVDGPVTRLTRRMPNQNRRIATSIVFLIIGLIVSLIIALIIPIVNNQGRELVAEVPSYISQLQESEGAFGRWAERIDLMARFETFLENIISGLTSSLDTVIDATSRLLSNLLIFIATILLAYLLAIEGPSWVEKIKSLAPPRIIAPASSLLGRMYHAVTGFVNGQLIITSISACATFIVITILALPSPLSLVAVIWVTGLIPLIGNTLGAVVVVMVALSQSLGVALFLTAFYIVYQQIENNVFEPIVQSKTIKMTPLFVLLSALIGLHLAGFVGALLALPAGACIKIIFNFLVDKHGFLEEDKGL